MPPANLRNKLTNAYLPFAKGFCKFPQHATLDLDIGADFVDATLALAAVDFQLFDSSTALRASHRRGFFALLRHLDSGLDPSLDFESRS